jgi:23S rRNA (cytosine1962-C5)-methyltransferase
LGIFFDLGGMVPEGKYLMFRNRLEKVYRHRAKLARRQSISCYRLYDRDLPEFPLIIEVYEDSVYVAEYKANHDLSDEDYAFWLDASIDMLEQVINVPREQIFCKRRERKADRQSQYQKLSEKGEEMVVGEGGLKFLVNLHDYLDTGLFLDHRMTRDMVRKEAKGKRFLNLFCYTGSFTVYAADGGASSSVSIDLSNTYIDWAQRNIQLNKLDDVKHRFTKGDVLQVLPGLPDQSFDLVVLDPPSFSNSKMMKDFLDIQEDHVELINLCLQKMAAGGILYFSTNLRSFKLDQEAIKASSIKDITRATTPFDFEGKLFRWCFKIVR